MDLFFIEWIVLIGIGIWFYRKTKFKNLRDSFDRKNTFHVLLVWIVFGFLFRLDYTQQWGCISYFEPIFELKNIVFSTISLGLIFAALKTPNQKLKKNYLIFELAYWILKLFIFKSGYVFGFGGGVNLTIAFYDSISVFLRLLIIFQVFEIKRIKLIAIPLLVYLIMAMKVLIFSTPLSFH